MVKWKEKGMKGPAARTQMKTCIRSDFSFPTSFETRFFEIKEKVKTERELSAIEALDLISRYFLIIPHF